MSTKIEKLLVANRSEIAIRVFRSAHELGIRTVAIYSYEDRYALHRFKADEAYMIGKQGEPIRAYLDIEAVVALAKEIGADAIHPGYGFLSENPGLATACQENGIKFVGPSVETLKGLGDKVTARALAQKADVPVLGGSNQALENYEEAKSVCEEMGYPVILKAAFGGGGRGMRVVTSPTELEGSLEQAQREAQTAFGNPAVFVEKFIQNAKHIEIQLLGDEHGNLVHLYERDCSVQRRHQKVVEIAPAPKLAPELRQGLCDAAIRIGKQANYQNAGTVEFLVDDDASKFYFIEVNPRIQVEHTVSEEVTGIDIVKSQLLIAGGEPLVSPQIGIESQESVQTRGFAMQCRVTTEDPTNGFMPDYGRISHYRSASGMGVRLDAGSAFSGAVVNPFYDSMLVKVTTRGRSFPEAILKMDRCLQEFRIRGVKTNIPFLIGLLKHPKFTASQYTTRFIDNTPELFDLPIRRDRATKILSYLGDVIVNGNSLVAGRPQATRREPAPIPELRMDKPPEGTRDLLKKMGRDDFCKWVLDQKELLLTDTTFRDAHQSLLATRVRTKDLLNISEVYSRNCSQLFSLEMWGGATFDTSMRFLKESPWDRLTQMRELVPNILFQMLLRASNAVGYTNYPDNVVKAFVAEAADAGMDIFRVFDALNWVPNMRVAMEAVLETDSLCEASICYTGDILDSKKSKYDMKYYVELAKELEKMGANILAIKDMAGLCKPYAAEKLVNTLKQEIGIPIHFHTHDTAGVQAASIVKGAEQNLDIADVAMAPLSGGTAQVNLNTIIESLRFTPQESTLDRKSVDEIADYWRAVREFYLPFESQVLPATGDLYVHEMPGGQYTNLFQQARALGLADRWAEVCQVYADVNDLFGNIVKVTPTSKAVGDMALFMVANELKKEDILDKSRTLAFPASVIDLIGGMMGQPPGGFPDEVIERVMRDQPPLTTRPGESLEPADFEKAAADCEEFMHRKPNQREVVSYLLYPKVFRDYIEHCNKHSDTSDIPTPNFLYGQEPGEEIAVDIEKGKRLIVKFLTVGEAHPDGTRAVFFELNGQPRDVKVLDQSMEADASAAVKADSSNPTHVGASMPGMVVTVAVAVGDSVTDGQKLLTMEAMKMESTIYAEKEGKIGQVLVKPGSQVDSNDLLLTIE